MLDGGIQMFDRHCRQRHDCAIDEFVLEQFRRQRILRCAAEGLVDFLFEHRAVFQGDVDLGGEVIVGGELFGGVGRDVNTR